LDGDQALPILPQDAQSVKSPAHPHFATRPRRSTPQQTARADVSHRRMGEHPGLAVCNACRSLSTENQFARYASKVSKTGPNILGEGFAPA